MCGLAGILLKSHQSQISLQDTISTMTDSLHHRGPDDGDIWVDNDARIAFGHKRLSIIDLSNNGLQPMHSKSRKYVITYNGEIYNHKELRKELEKSGHNQWYGTSDTEVILVAIEHWGLENAISKFIGMFAFSLWDKEEKLLYLVRDRMGIKPLYWSVQNGTFLFGSELKSLKVTGLLKSEIDLNSLALYMKYKYVPCPTTIFKNVFQLEPATILQFDKNNNIKKIKYWNLNDVVKTGIDNCNNSDDSIDDVINIINEAVKCRLVSDVPIGAFLSGGVDSSAIAALMQQNSTTPVNTFSIGFTNDSYDESHYAREVSQKLGTNHTEFILETQDALDVIPKLPQIYDEPFSDSSQIPTYLVSKLTSDEVKVALSGDGGDEIFGGYNRYIYADKYFDKINRLPESLQKLFRILIYALPKNTWNNIFSCLPKKLNHSQGGDKLYKLADVVGKNKVEMYERLISDWQFNEKLFNFDIEYRDIELSLPEFMNNGFSVEYMQLMDQSYYLPNDILTKVDRASMSNALEVRVPFLDHRIVELMWRQPRTHKINNGISKVILKKILGDYVPSVNFERAKTGFSLPISEWLRGDLRDWAEDLLDDKKMNQHGLLNYRIIRKKWDEHQSGKNNWHEHIWSILMFNAWYEHWIKEK
jgi:asparagine synthase (glutamine-hydrolysing)